MRNFAFFLFILGGITCLSQERKHGVKLNLLALTAKTISFQYEYSLTPKKSLLCQVGYTFPSYLLEKQYGKYKSFEDNRKIIFRELKFHGGFQVTPEFRYYVKEKEDKLNRGFYIGAYFRYARYVLSSRVDYTSDNFNVGFTFKGA